MNTEKQITDTDWLEFNASKLGIKPDWTYVLIDEDDFDYNTMTKEYTEIRKKIDERMEHE